MNCEDLLDLTLDGVTLSGQAKRMVSAALSVRFIILWTVNGFYDSCIRLLIRRSQALSGLGQFSLSLPGNPLKEASLILNPGDFHLESHDFLALPLTFLTCLEGL